MPILYPPPAQSQPVYTPAPAPAPAQASDPTAFLLRQRQLALERAAARDTAPIDRGHVVPPHEEDDDTAERMRMLAEVRQQRQAEKEAARQQKVATSQQEPSYSVSGGRFQRDDALPLRHDDMSDRQAMFADIMAERRREKGGAAEPTRFGRFPRAPGSATESFTAQDPAYPPPSSEYSREVLLFVFSTHSSCVAQVGCVNGLLC